MPSPRDVWRAMARTGRLMVGVRDYQDYLAHRHASHPGEPAMTLAEFHRNRVDRRYGGGPDGTPRCC